MATPPIELVLASSSPRRQQLMTEAGYKFRVLPPDPQAECGACSSGGPIELVCEYAIRKATDVARQIVEQVPSSDILLLAADTVAECQGQILGKPRDEDHARQMLQLMQGRVHRVLTGICVWRLSVSEPAGSPHVEAVATTLKMDKITDEQLDEYLSSGGWEGKAGGFGYQDRLGWIHIQEGSESNVVGLPMERVEQLLTAEKVLPLRIS